MVELFSGLRPRTFARLITRLRCDGADRPLRVGRGSVPQRGGDRRRRLPGRAHRRAPGAELSEWKQADNKSHRRVRARVEHVFARMKTWKILRDYRLRGDGHSGRPRPHPLTQTSTPDPARLSRTYGKTLRPSRACSRVSRGRGHRCPRASPYARLREGIGARHPAPPRTGVPRPGPTGGRNPRRSRGGASGWR